MLLIQRLKSGYWYARWSSEIWAQWPCDRGPRPEDFFHPNWTATPDRLQEVAEAIDRWIKETTSGQ